MTAQCPDYLTRNGVREYTHSYLFTQLPADHAIVKSVPWGNAFKESWDIVSCTAYMRCYHASWEIRGGGLFLINVRGIYMMTSDTPVLADWFSGTVVIEGINQYRDECTEKISLVIQAGKLYDSL